MDIKRAIEIVSGLADGIDPINGEVYPDDSPYHNPEIIRALYTILKVAESNKTREKRKRSVHQNAGKPWPQQEDQELQKQFEYGWKISEISKMHGRTEWAIRSRLEKLGLITSQY